MAKVTPQILHAPGREQLSIFGMTFPPWGFEPAIFLLKSNEAFVRRVTLAQYNYVDKADKMLMVYNLLIYGFNERIETWSHLSLNIFICLYNSNSCSADLYVFHWFIDRLVVKVTSLFHKIKHFTCRHLCYDVLVFSK